MTNQPTVADLMSVLMDAFTTMQQRAYTPAGRGDYSQYMRVVRELRGLGVEPYINQPLSVFDPFSWPGR